MPHPSLEGCARTARPAPLRQSGRPKGPLQQGWPFFIQGTALPGSHQAPTSTSRIGDDGHILSDTPCAQSFQNKRRGRICQTTPQLHSTPCPPMRWQTWSNDSHWPPRPATRQTAPKLNAGTKTSCGGCGKPASEQREPPRLSRRRAVGWRGAEESTRCSRPAQPCTELL